MVEFYLKGIKIVLKKYIWRFFVKKFLSSMSVLLLLAGCSTKIVPTKDISNAKMALIKAESQDAKTYAPDDLVRVKVKYQNLQRLMHEERYEEAKFLAQEIQADARLLEKKSQRIEVQNKAKKLSGEINTINKDFTQIRD